MNGFSKAALCIAVFLCATTATRGQDKPAETKQSATAFTIRVVLTEYDGEKKVSSLPYTLTALIGGARRLTSMRSGVRVPISTESKDSKYQYEDIGTNLDVTDFEQMQDGRYEVAMTVARSSVYLSSKDAQNQGIEWTPGSERPSTLPLVRETRLLFAVLLRDGQSAEGAEVTDPLTGRVLKTQVSLAAAK
jgi:hypothetical protein